MKWWNFAWAMGVLGCDWDDDDDDQTNPTVVQVPDGPAGLAEAPTPTQGTDWPLHMSWHWQRSGSVAPNRSADLLVGLPQPGFTTFCEMRPSKADDGSDLDVGRQSTVDRGLAQLDAAQAAGCAGVVLFELEGPDSGERRALAQHLANEAHARGLDVAQGGWTNGVDVLVDYADLVVAPRCASEGTCEAFDAYTERGKPVLVAEFSPSFRADPAAFCRDMLIRALRGLLLDEALDGTDVVSCDTDFPSVTRLADVQTYATYYGRDANALDAMADLDLAIVQPLLTAEQRRAIQARGPVVAYLSIGEIGLSNTYLVDGEEVLGQTIYDASPEWFLGENPFFDSWFADTTQVGWQDFVLGQAQQLHDLGYDGLFLDTVDTVDVYPDTIPGMVELIGRLRTQHPEGILVQNRGMNVIPQTGPDVDALMFEVFSTRYDFEQTDYARTDTQAPGYPEIVEKAVDYRLSGGVVLAQDFGTPDTDPDLLCYARNRALHHRFVPSYADKFFVEPPTTFPEACPWVDTPRPAAALFPRVAHVTADRGVTLRIEHRGEGGFNEALEVSVLETSGLTARVTQSTLPSGGTLDLVIDPATLEAGPRHIHLALRGAGASFDLDVPVFVHEQTIWVTNAGLSNVVAFDEPTTLGEPARADRVSGEAIAQPYAIAISPTGERFVVENVGDPDAPQPAGRVVIYDRFALASPREVVSTGLLYPTGIAFEADGSALVVNSALDWTGTPRGTPAIVRIAPGASEAIEAFHYDASIYGYPLSIAIAPNGDIYLGTTYGIVLGFPASASGSVTPGVALVGDDLFDTVRSITWREDALWFSGSKYGQSVVGALVQDWDLDGNVVTRGIADASVRITEGLFGPWGLAFDESGRLWVVNSTDAEDNADSRGSLLRFDMPTTGASPDQNSPLASRYTLRLAVGRP
ncbi:MAG: endo alpha-1,4 polygalactosaminidase [Myxococcota bacterium]